LKDSEKTLDNPPKQEYKESEEWLIKVVVLLFLFSAKGLDVGRKAKT
jgi:hypothetical protein